MSMQRYFRGVDVKTSMFLFVSLCLLSGTCGASNVPSSQWGALSQFIDTPPISSFDAPSLLSEFTSTPFPSPYLDFPGSLVISPFKATTIAEHNSGVSIPFRTNTHLDWIYSLDKPDAPVYEVTVTGLKMTGPESFSVLSSKVKIDGYTGNVIG